MFVSKTGKIYQRALKFADNILCLTEKTREGQEAVACLLEAAAVSICVSLSEGYECFGKKGSREFLISAGVSCLNCVPLFILLKRMRKINVFTCAVMRAEAEHVADMLSDLINETS